MKAPHLTPRSLVGRRFPPDVFDGVRIALVGYCPPPPALARYAHETSNEQRFIHLAPERATVLVVDGRRLLSLTHVYGGPVSSATIEELAYYGVTHVLAYGLAGGLGTKGLVMGDFYLVDDALARDGTTPHYTDARIVAADAALRDRVVATWSGGAPLHRVRAGTGDAIYRETDAFLHDLRAAGCELVNCDTAHLYAVSRANAEGRTLATVQCGVVSDVVHADPARDVESTLAAMLAPGARDAIDPLARTGEIVQFYVETLAPQLA